MSLIGERLVDLRHLHGLTQRELAESVDIAASFVSRIENEEREFTQDLAERLALRYKLPLSFFSALDPIPNVEPPTYRKYASTTARESNLVNTLQKLAMRLFHKVSIDSGYREWNDPNPEGLVDPEEAAATARSFFGLDESQPVRNVSRLLERNGAGVVDNLYPRADEKVVRRHHGVTRPSPTDGRPVVAIFDSGRGDVNRMTLAHELGHLVHDRHDQSGTPREKEDRAFRFAGAFLLPKEAVMHWITPDLPLSGYLAIKSQFGVSVSAAIRRGKDLGLIDPERYRSLMIQHSSRGWRTNEPGTVHLETTSLLAQAVQKAYPCGMVKEASKLSGVPEDLVHAWTGHSLINPPPERGAAPHNVVSLNAARRRRYSA